MFNTRLQWHSSTGDIHISGTLFSYSMTNNFRQWIYFYYFRFLHFFFCFFRVSWKIYSSENLKWHFLWKRLERISGKIHLHEYIHIRGFIRHVKVNHVLTSFFVRWFIFDFFFSCYFPPLNSFFFSSFYPKKKE